jgi:hypothetical protein
MSEPVPESLQVSNRAVQGDRAPPAHLAARAPSGGAHTCYATHHGISYLTEYAPDDRLLALAARTAAQHPHLEVTGKAMLTLDEVSNLRDHDRAALCLPRRRGAPESCYL